MVRLEESAGEVIHSFLPSLDTAAAVAVDNYTIASTSDAHYATPTKPVAAFRKTKVSGTDRGWPNCNCTFEHTIFLKLPGVEPWPLVNPEIVESSEERMVVWDACLSFLSIFMQVERRRWVTVRYQNLEGETLSFDAGNDRDLSELMQHEIDHLDGILAIDRVFDLKTICTREEFEKRHRDQSPYAAVPVRIRH